MTTTHFPGKNFNSLISRPIIFPLLIPDNLQSLARDRSGKTENACFALDRYLCARVNAG
ncbi:hypothetical protein IQ209_16535 [Xenorhabdus sp. BG5]|uniref:hypothetical protein n=1 Tax=Xenorhabdus sp. BG5 TaxID=2782014 RepID=UPI00187F8D3F|nr:hypothetical protein [Xenorhabdus sp. BG5]MBE8598058.1 hypothetical protein [Xenorhabdus sp. BG5]